MPYTFTISGISACQVAPWNLLDWTKEMRPFVRKCNFDSLEEAKVAANAFDKRFPGLFVEVHNHECDDCSEPYWRWGLDFSQECGHGCNLERRK
jgi:hypothetical protein